MNGSITKHFVNTAAAFHALIEGVREGAAILSADGTILTCNRRLAEMLKLECEHVMGRPIRLFVISDDQAPLEELFQSLPEQFTMIQVRLTGSNALPLPAELAIKTLIVNDVHVFSVLATDLSRRRRAEEQLTFQAHVLANVSDAVCAMDESYRIIFWNPAAERLYGWKSDEVLGRAAADVVRVQLSDTETAQAARQLAATGQLRNELTHRRRDGTAIMVESMTTARRAEDGHLIGYVSVGRDITERVRAADEIRRLNAELEQRVAERTVELELAYKELEAFSYSVSHDLRTPLASIEHLVRLVLDDCKAELPAGGRQGLELIQANILAMETLIAGLLAFSRYSRQPLNKQPVDLTQLVQQVWASLATQRGGRQIEFVIGGLPACQADPFLLKQVLVNLLSNAVKFTRTREHARIEVGSANLVYFVRDNGVGFSMESAEKLFHVFQRLHPEEDYEGTGVGLAIVQRIIQRHGGRVCAEGAENEGATFYFTL